MLSITYQLQLLKVHSNAQKLLSYIEENYLYNFFGQKLRFYATV